MDDLTIAILVWLIIFTFFVFIVLSGYPSRIRNSQTYDPQYVKQDVLTFITLIVVFIFLVTFIKEIIHIDHINYNIKNIILLIISASPILFLIPNSSWK